MKLLSSAPSRLVLSSFSLLLLLTVLVAPNALASIAAQTTTGAISGRVATTDGSPVAGAAVTAGPATRTTDAAGNFTITGLAPVERLAVTVRANGYIPTSRIFTVVAGVTVVNNVTLTRQTAPIAVNIDNGAALPIAGTSGTLTIAPGSLRDPGGNVVRGTVTARLSHIDVTQPEQLRSAPGDFTAIQLDGSRVPLETAGMFEFIITDSAGNRAELAPGATAQLSFAPTDLPFVGTSMGLYAFDSASGRWIERGVIKQDGAASSTGRRLAGVPLQRTGQFTGSINTLRVVWNIDKPFNWVWIRVRVVNSAGALVPYRGVTATGVNFRGFSQNYTDKSGATCLQVPGGATIDINSVNSAPVRVTVPTSGPANCTDPGVPSYTVPGF